MSIKALSVIIGIMTVTTGALFYAGTQLNNNSKINLSTEEVSPNNTVINTPDLTQTQDVQNTKVAVQPSVSKSSSPQALPPAEKKSKLIPKVWETPAGQRACNFLLTRDDLMELLPSPPPGYVNTVPSMVYRYEDISGQVTSAKAYLKPNTTPKQEVEIVIAEYCEDASSTWDPITGVYRSSSSFLQTTEAILIKGNKALKEHYMGNEDRYSYAVLVGKHIIIIANGEDGTPDADVLFAVENVNYSKLEKLLDQWEF